MDKWEDGTIFCNFRRICWILKLRQVIEKDKEVTKNRKVKQIVAAQICRNFHRIWWIKKPRLVSEKSKEVTENREVRKLVAAAILRGKCTQSRKNFVIVCNPGHKSSGKIIWRYIYACEAGASLEGFSVFSFEFEQSFLFKANLNW